MKRIFLIFATGFLLIAGFTACEDDSQDNVTVKTVPLSGTQQVPAVTTTGTGTVTYAYNPSYKSLTYTITWSGLSSNALDTIGIYGPASRGQVATAGITRPFQLIRLNSTQRQPSGSYSGSLLIDGTAIKAEDLFAGKYYVNLRSVNFTNGELRAQLEF